MNKIRTPLYSSTFKLYKGLSLVAEMGFEPHDLRVMSPTSYQAAPLRDIFNFDFRFCGAGNRARTGTGG